MSCVPCCWVCEQLTPGTSQYHGSVQYNNVQSWLGIPCFFISFTSSSTKNGKSSVLLGACSQKWRHLFMGQFFLIKILNFWKLVSKVCNFGTVTVSQFFTRNYYHHTKPIHIWRGCCAPSMTSSYLTQIPSHWAPNCKITTQKRKPVINIWSWSSPRSAEY